MLDDPAADACAARCIAQALADDLIAQNAPHLWAHRVGPEDVAIDGRPDLVRLARVALAQMGRGRPTTAVSEQRA